MPDIKPITRKRFAPLRWNRPGSFAFAADQALAPLALNELSVACLYLPIAVLANGEDWGVAAVLGVPPSTSLRVARDGRWLGAYIPTSLRCYPFSLVVRAPDNQAILCIDEASGLVHSGPQGERFFNDDGTPADTLTQTLQFLTQWEHSRQAAVRACSALHRHGLIQPWPVSVRSPTGDTPVGGLARIDEAALNQLPAAALHELNQTGALALAYCQLLSMQHFKGMGSTAVQAAGASTPASPAAASSSSAPATAAASGSAAIPSTLLNAAGDLDLGFLGKGGTLQFGKPC